MLSQCFSAIQHFNLELSYKLHCGPGHSSPTVRFSQIIKISSSIVRSLYMLSTMLLSTFSGTKVVLFCVRADFNGDEVCLSFCGDNGIRSVLLNASIQYPLVQVKK